MRGRKKESEKKKKTTLSENKRKNYISMERGKGKVSSLTNARLPSFFSQTTALPLLNQIKCNGEGECREMIEKTKGKEEEEVKEEKYVEMGSRYGVIKRKNRIQ